MAIKTGSLILTENVNNIENNDSVQDTLTFFGEKHNDQIKEAFGLKDTDMLSLGMGSHWLFVLGFTITLINKGDDVTLHLTR